MGFVVNARMGPVRIVEAVDLSPSEARVPGTVL
jgi:hypothetical protein